HRAHRLRAQQRALRLGRDCLRRIRILKRVFAIDALTCPYCGGPRKLIALLTDGLVVRQILAHLRLPIEPLPLAVG
ncbi:MAG TPA: hypothetical protein VMM35_04910, partial [Longimicrobiales bacterium]|nr:hypothetical protein [Longimicrobiales bacterium]